MNTIADLMRYLSEIAPFSLQESYDNSGLIYGNPANPISGLLISLDLTEEVLDEALSKKCNVVLSHHPVIFSAFKRLDINSSTHRVLVRAIKNDIAVIAFHTNLDNSSPGISSAMAEKLGLMGGRPLSKSTSKLKKLAVFVPDSHLADVRMALGKAGAGRIGNYDFCSFTYSGTGTFRPGPNARPYIGAAGELTYVPEQKLEVIFPEYIRENVMKALREAHPYEEIAFDLFDLDLPDPNTGFGWMASLPEPLSPSGFLDRIKAVFKTPAIRFSNVAETKIIKKVAVCGGSGAFLISAALREGADALVTADLKYHQFFEAENNLLLADIGHFESEIHFIEQMDSEIKKKMPNFAVHLSGVNTNPVHYWI
jgi:dinuclear metal center YbgI/SA1388 family protein